MFQFTTTTLINSSDQFETIYKSDGTTIVGCRAVDGPAFKLADKDCITVYKALYEAEVADKAVIDLSACTDTDKTYRINLYVRSQANADPMFANDFVFKGKPFVIEFAGADGGKVAAKIAKLAEKYQLALYDLKQLNIEATSDTELTITGINGYQRLYRVAVEEWEASASYEGKWTVIDSVEGTTEVVSGVKTSDNGTITVTVGNEGKGTYDQILADIRIPSADNFAYMNANAPEMPIIGGKYNQYTIYLRKELKGYPGGIGINNPVESITTHVFFVESGAVSAFEEALKNGIGYDYSGTDTADDFAAKDTKNASDNKDKALAGSADTTINEI